MLRSKPTIKQKRLNGMFPITKAAPQPFILENLIWAFVVEHGNSKLCTIFLLGRRYFSPSVH